MLRHPPRRTVTFPSYCDAPVIILCNMLPPNVATRSQRSTRSLRTTGACGLCVARSGAPSHSEADASLRRMSLSKIARPCRWGMSLTGRSGQGHGGQASSPSLGTGAAAQRPQSWSSGTRSTRESREERSYPYDRCRRRNWLPSGGSVGVRATMMSSPPS